MNYKIFLLIALFFITSCKNINITNEIPSTNIQKKFSNKGFALIYSDDLRKNKIISNKIDDRSLLIIQRNLRKNSAVKITNLLNSKSTIAKVISSNNYPIFYNSVLSKRIQKELEINEIEPYIEITQLIGNSSFIAKKAKTFDEEKKVAAKAPIEDIKIKDLSNKKKKKSIINKNSFNYVIKIADFYFNESAKSMSLRIKDETTIKKVNIDKINPNNFRVYIGPYKDLISLKNAFNAISILQFDNIEILKK